MEENVPTLMANKFGDVDFQSHYFWVSFDICLHLISLKTWLCSTNFLAFVIFLDKHQVKN